MLSSDAAVRPPLEWYWGEQLEARPPPAPGGWQSAALRPSGGPAPPRCTATDGAWQEVAKCVRACAEALPGCQSACLF